LEGRQVHDGSCVDFWGYFDPDDDPHQGDWNATFGNINESDFAGIGITANFDLGGLTLTSVTGYDELDRRLSEDVDNSPFASIEDLHEDDIESFSQELRLTSNGNSDFDWIAGVFYSDDSLNRILTEDVTDLDGFILQGDIKQDSNSLALFAHGDISLSENLRLGGGIRFTDEEKDYSIVRSDDGAIVFSGVENLDDNDVSGDISLDYSLNDDVLLYAKVAKGYKSGNFNGSVAVSSQDQIVPTEAEEVYAYELGYKGMLLDGSMRLNMSAYFNQWNNFQNRGVSLINGNLTSTLITAGDAEITGFEADLLWLPTDGLEIALGANLMDAAVVRGIVDPGTGEEVNRGNKLQNSPDLTLNGRVAYRWPVAGNLEASIQGDFSWQDDVLFNVDNNPFHAQDSYSLYGARASIGAADGRWELSVWSRNLGDEDYRVEVFDIFDLGSSLFIYGEPRTSGLTFRYNY
jgi:iron complex outermembrane receptor protein